MLHFALSNQLRRAVGVECVISRHEIAHQAMLEVPPPRSISRDLRAHLPRSPWGSSLPRRTHSRTSCRKPLGLWRLQTHWRRSTAMRARTHGRLAVRESFVRSVSHREAQARRIRPVP